MWVLRRYLNGSVIQVLLGATLVLVLISAADLLAQYLEAAARSEVVAALIPFLILLSLPHNLSFIWPLAFFIALIDTSGRFYASREMDVLHAVGFSDLTLARVLLPVFLFAASIQGSLLMWWLPESMGQFERLHNEKRGRDLLDQLVAGKPLGLGNNVMVYAADRAGDDAFRDLLVVQQMLDAWHITAAPRARKQWLDDQQSKYLRLEEMTFFQLEHQGALQVHTAETTWWRIPGQAPHLSLDRLEAKTNQALRTSSDPSDQAQWQWRLSGIFSMGVLFLWGMQFGKLHPRQRRFSAFPKAFVLYLSYVLIQQWVYRLMVQASIPLLPGLYAVHVGALALWAFSVWRWRTR